MVVFDKHAIRKGAPMKSLLKNLFVAIVLVVFTTHMASAQWVKLLGGACGSLAAQGNVIYAIISLGTDVVFRSTNNGMTWTIVNPGVSVSTLALSGCAAGFAYGVCLTTKNDTIWTVGSSTACFGPYLVVSIACTPVLLVGTYGGGVFRLDGAKVGCWTPVDSGLPANTGVPSLAALYVLQEYNFFAGTNGHGIFRSTSSNNYGISWTPVDSGLPVNTYVYSLAVSGSNIFAGTSGQGIFGHGIFLSTNNGKSWTEVDSGLFADSLHPICYGTFLVVSGGYLFAGISCSNGGVWRRPLSEMIEAVQQGISKPYTNGFKINISRKGIALMLPQTLTKDILTIGLFNVAGKRIYSATHQTNRGTLNIPLAGFSTGAYLMTIKGSNTALSSSFVVTK